LPHLDAALVSVKDSEEHLLPPDVIVQSPLGARRSGLHRVGANVNGLWLDHIATRLDDPARTRIGDHRLRNIGERYFGAPDPAKFAYVPDGGPFALSTRGGGGGRKLPWYLGATDRIFILRLRYFKMVRFALI
jgi:hypothetical protein